MIEIQLYGKHGLGKYAIVDDQDAYLAQWRWRVDKYGYARRGFYENGGKRTRLMHHLIQPLKDGLVVDHINRNRLDNRRENLRLADRVLNRRNSSQKSREGYDFPYLQAYIRKDSLSLEWCGYAVLSYSGGKTTRKYLGSAKTKELLVEKYEQFTKLL